MSDFSKAEQQNILRFAESNMNFEGFIVPANAKKKYACLMNGTKSADEIIKVYLTMNNSRLK